MQESTGPVESIETKCKNLQMKQKTSETRAALMIAWSNLITEELNEAQKSDTDLIELYNKTFSVKEAD